VEGFYDEEDDQSAASLPTLSSGVGPRKAAAKPFDLVAAKEVGFGQEGGGGGGDGRGRPTGGKPNSGWPHSRALGRSCCDWW
jgi:hypothetical protein